MADLARTSGLFAGLLLAGSGPSAHANPLFPSEIKNVCGISYTPPCTVCHNTPTGGIGTAVQPFAISMKTHGLVDPQVSTVDTALNAEKADHTDSNGDGIDDWDSLVMGLDPNTGLSLTGPNPVYGCGGRIGGETRPGGALAPLLGLALALAASSAWRRRALRCAFPTTRR